MPKVKIDNISAEIALAVKDYTEEVTEAIIKELDTTSKAVLKDVRANSPVGKTGEYKKGWTRKKETSGGQVRYVIHNKKKPWLAHLLEFGHAKKGGGRVSGIPHLLPAYDSHVPDMEDRIKEIVKKGG